MKEKTTNLSIQIPKNLDQSIERISRRSLISKSAFVRMAILAAVKGETVVSSGNKEEPKK